MKTLDTLRQHHARISGQIEASEDEVTEAISYVAAAIILAIICVLSFLTITAILFWIIGVAFFIKMLLS